MKLDFLEKRLSLAQRRPLIANLYTIPERGFLEIHGQGGGGGGGDARFSDS